VKSSALEVDGGDRRHFVVCGTEGTFHIQPLDNPRARVALSQKRGDYPRGYQDISFPKFTRYTADAADMARVIRGEKADFFDHDQPYNRSAASVRIAPGEIRPWHDAISTLLLARLRLALRRCFCGSAWPKPRLRRREVPGRLLPRRLATGMRPL
jgi:hypothetical protein